jgi:protein-tyrosine phosphatase
MISLLMVCTGNVCRSPMAQVVARHLAMQADLSRSTQIESAGTHVGRSKGPMDPRAKAVLSSRGYAIGRSGSRQILERDFNRYDLILAMDQTNLSDLRRMCPAGQVHKLHLFLEFAEGADTYCVPDPYYGNAEGFARVLELCESGARGLITHYFK